MANGTSNTVSVLLNNGNGTFAAKTDYSAGGTPFSVASADVNNDGKVDLLVANDSSTTVSILLNNGNGTFAPKVDYTTGSNPYSVTSADVNSDGKADLMVANGASDTVSVLLNNGTPAATAFTEGANAASTPVAIDTTLILGDTDNSTLASATVSITANLQSAEDLLAFNNTNAATYGNISATYTSGTGVLALTSAGATVTVAQWQAALRAVTYTNSSDTPNTANRTVSFVINDGTTDSTAITKTVSVTAVNDLPAITSSAAVNVAENTTAVTTVTSTDADGDTVTYSITGGADQAKFSINTNTGALVFATAPNFEAPTDSDNNNSYLVQVTANDGNGGTVNQTITATVTDVADNAAPTIKQVVSLSFAAKVDYATGSNPSSVASVDVNSDGTADLLVVNNGSNTASVLQGNGDGTFAAKVDYTTGSGPLSVASADVNNDAKADLLVANKGSNTVSLLLNNGDGTFAPKVDYITGNWPVFVTSTDANNDAKIDLLVANYFGNTVSLLLNNGDGTFASKVDYATGNQPCSVASADHNNDGKADLVVVNQTSNTVSVLLNNGDGTFAPKVDYATGAAPRSVTSADVNNDAKADLLVANQTSNTVSVLLGNGDGTFAAKVDYATGSSPSSVTSADVNNDGKADLLVANFSSNTVSVLLNNGNGTFAANVDYSTGSGPLSVTSVDINSDAKADLLLTNNDSNTVSVLLNNGVPLPTAFTEGANVASTPVAIDTTLILADTDNSTLASATVSITANLQSSEDLLAFSNTNAATYGNIAATYTSGTGVLALTSAGATATVAQWQAALRAVTYSNSSETPNTANRTVSFVINDGTADSNAITKTVSVTAVNDLPAITSAAAVNVAENTTAVTTVTSTDADGDTVTYSITGGADQAKFSINANTGALAFATAPDYETPTDADSNNSYLVQVTANDGHGGTVNQTITATVTDVAENAAPVITSAAAFNVAENTTAVTTVTATDADLDTITYSITGGADQAKFNINATTGALVFATAPNFEAPTDADSNNSYLVQVTANDSNGGTVNQTITATVTDVAENAAPVITSAAAVNVAENSTAVTTVTSTDADGDTVSYSITGGADQAKFNIVGATGVLTFATAPNFEAPTDSDSNNSYLVQVTANDSHGGTVNQTITATVTDVAENAAPVITSAAAVNVAENSTAVTTVTSTDADGNTVTYSITGGADQARFNINSTSGLLSFITAPNFEAPTDADSNNGYLVQVTANDGHGGMVNQTITATVTDVAETPPPVEPPVTPPIVLPVLDEDNDGISSAIEGLVPSLLITGTGDGNGDGIADNQQASVTSTPFHNTSQVSKHPDATQLFVTLVVDSVQGIPVEGSNAHLTSLQQLDAPVGFPAEMQMPLGRIAFIADVGQSGITETFSLFVDNSISLNGYWKQNSAGTWCNLATTIETVGAKTRIDFAITDGGEFDADGLANGIIVDPGAVGSMPLSIAGANPVSSGTGFWF